MTVSEKTRIPLAEAEGLAAEVVALLAPYCERIEVAGSIRRRRPDVGDIEIVCVPKREVLFETREFAMFGPERGTHTVWEDCLDRQCKELLQQGVFTPRRDVLGHAALGPKYKRLSYRGFGLDLFAVTEPAQFGVVFTIRTGPASFSQRLVTSTWSGGLLPPAFQVKDGALWWRSSGEVVPTPEESDFFARIGVRYIEPHERA